MAAAWRLLLGGLTNDETPNRSFTAARLANRERELSGGVGAALRFLAAQRGWMGPAPRAGSLSMGGFDWALLEPSGRPRGTVMTIHGMAPIALRDVRMRAVHHGLIAAGFRVLSPLIPSVAELRIELAQIDTIERAILLLTEREDLCPDGRTALLSISFSAGLGLIAAGRPAVSDKVRAICSIGAYGDIVPVVNELLLRRDTTSYVWKIVFANFLDAALGPCDALRETFRQAALDEFYVREARPPRLPSHIAALPPEQRDLVRELLFSSQARRAIWERMHRGGHPFLTGGSVVAGAKSVSAAVTLLHGLHDPTIPSSESVRIHDALQAAGGRSRLLRTPLLGHGDTTVGKTTTADYRALVSAMGGWMEDAEGPGGVRRIAGSG